MALIVPVLRLMMLFLNIYDSLKVLKLPRPSARNSGQPTVRALSQRKRNMKGCLAVWIVWCCFIIYERMAEGIVSLFIPFYDEVKSLVLLFLIFTRARGAEPIFLHVIRPLLKPYTSTLDALSDVARMFGDIVFLLLTYPFHLALSRWHSAFAHRDSVVEDEANGGPYNEVQQALHSVSHQMPAQAGGRRRSSGPVRTDFFAPDSVVSEPNVAPPPYLATESVAQPPRRVSGHEIWHPPRSAYHDEEDDPAPVDPPLESQEAQRERQHMEEWRQYPPFPSAYPPTPLLPSSSRLPDPLSSIHDMSTFAPPAQDFGQSLLSPHELSNSGSARGSSDEDNVLGIQNTPPTASQDDTMDEDEDDEEDDFNVTLRTPGSEPAAVPSTIMAPRTRSRTKASIPPTATVVPLPSLLSRISSDTSSVSSDSSADSLVGRKRSRELVPAQAAVRRGRVVSQPISISTHRTVERMEDESSAADSSATSDDDEGDADRDTSVNEPQSPLMKKRRVASAPSRVQPRRTTRSASREPSTAVDPPPMPTRRQRQPKAKAQPPVSDVLSATASSRRANGAAADAASRQKVTAADQDGLTNARPSRRAGARTAVP
ncbi:hypothetical protein MVEN_01195000 [Mycena venus]|uniref:Protein YOP1 n=1 Tax=Mycena venus TaxID=2733690 RepID=A0A8H6Y2W6_9AGAR|nr:hypothetical protein MVEN_01195000 [Mycena venus]